jgi:hypothetical protein
MAALCFFYRPDADKIFSLFAGTQYLVEGIGSLFALLSVLNLGGSADLAFTLAVTAVFVPISQLLEQRLLTPFAKSVRTRGCDPYAWCAALTLILFSVPKALKKLGTRTGGGSPDADNGINALATSSLAASRALASYGSRDVHWSQSSVKTKPLQAALSGFC